MPLHPSLQYHRRESDGRRNRCQPNEPRSTSFYVIEGELTFQLGDELFTRKAGELAFAPRRVPHTYANLSAAPTHHLIVCTPGGFERYFVRMAAERRGEEPPEWALRPIPEATTVGPRIGERPGDKP